MRDRGKVERQKKEGGKEGGREEGKERKTEIKKKKKKKQEQKERKASSTLSLNKIQGISSMSLILQEQLEPS